MTIEYGNLKFFGWPKVTETGIPIDWMLDEEDEKQIEADCDGLDSTIQYLEDKVKRIGIKENSTQEKR